MKLSPTPYPMATVAEVAQRFPDQAVRKKTSLDKAPCILQVLKSVHAGSKVLRAGNTTR